jgi:hypothetical protein
MGSVLARARRSAATMRGENPAAHSDPLACKSASARKNPDNLRAIHDGETLSPLILHRGANPYLGGDRAPAVGSHAAGNSNSAGE